MTWREARQLFLYAFALVGMLVVVLLATSGINVSDVTNNDLDRKLDRIERKVDTMLEEEYHFRIEKGSKAGDPATHNSAGGEK